MHAIQHRFPWNNLIVKYYDKLYHIELNISQWNSDIAEKSILHLHSLVSPFLLYIKDSYYFMKVKNIFAVRWYTSTISQFRSMCIICLTQHILPPYKINHFWVSKVCYSDACKYLWLSSLTASPLCQIKAHKLYLDIYLCVIEIIKRIDVQKVKISKILSWSWVINIPN